MDILVPKVGEIIGGSQREERLDVLEARMREQGLDPAELLVVSRPAPLRHRAALGLRPGRWSAPSSSSPAWRNIRDVIPFPRTPGTADF